MTLFNRDTGRRRQQKCRRPQFERKKNRAKYFPLTDDPTKQTEKKIAHPINDKSSI